MMTSRLNLWCHLFCLVSDGNTVKRKSKIFFEAAILPENDFVACFYRENGWVKDVGKFYEKNDRRFIPFIYFQIVHFQTFERDDQFSEDATSFLVLQSVKIISR